MDILSSALNRFPFPRRPKLYLGRKSKNNFI